MSRHGLPKAPRFRFQHRILPAALSLLLLVEPTLTGCASTRRVPLDSNLPAAPPSQERGHLKIRGYTRSLEGPVYEFRGYATAIGPDSLRLVSTRAKPVWWTLLVWAPAYLFVRRNVPVDSVLVARNEISTITVPRLRTARTAAVVVAIVAVSVGALFLMFSALDAESGDSSWGARLSP